MSVEQTRPALAPPYPGVTEAGNILASEEHETKDKHSGQGTEGRAFAGILDQRFKRPVETIGAESSL